MNIVEKAGSLSSPWGNIHYHIDGPSNGRPLLLIHGATVASWEYSAILPKLIERGFLCFRYDLFGHGKSTHPRTLFSLDLFVDQAQYVLERLLGNTPCYLVGHSLGGTIATALLARCHYRIKHAVLAAPMLNFSANNPFSHILNTPVLGYLFMATLGRYFLRRRRHHRFEQMQLPNLKAAFDEQYFKHGYWQSMWKLEKHGVLGNQSTAYEAARLFSYKADILYGSNDAIIPLSDIEIICEHLGKSADDVVVMDEMEHNLLLRHPLQLANTITQLLLHEKNRFYEQHKMVV